MFRSNDGLRTKSRITVPQDSGRNMMGVLDETLTLEYGQVFVQYTEITCSDCPGDASDHPGTRVLTGDVVVTKCPCLHPGDVRKFIAVDIPALHHIKDCIVFPAKGLRPHANEMAGSDLDGDEYIVIWEKDLLFPGHNAIPMIFSDDSRSIQSDIGLVDGMVRFICDYIKNDNVGIMSNAHLAMADMLDKGIFSKPCLSLARKISTSVDFAKTGAASHMTREEKPKLYPDFMEKRDNKDTYRSNGVLGHLYRLQRFLESTIMTDFRAHYVDGEGNSKLFEYPGWQTYQKNAELALAVYSEEMEQILCHYGIKTEGEVVAGLINSVSSYNASSGERNNVGLVVDKRYRYLIEQTRERFFADVHVATRAITDPTDSEKTRVLLRMASAWYMVTCAAVKKSNCQSFPWSVVDVLLLVMKAVRTFKSNPVPGNLLIMKLNKALAEESLSKSNEVLALEVIMKWATKEELTRQANWGRSRICETCLTLLFNGFLSDTRDPLADVSEHLENLLIHPISRENVFQREGTSVGDLIVGFLRYISSASVMFPTCNICSWSSSQTHGITMAALRTYNMLAMFSDLCFLGLPCDPSLHEPRQDIREGNLIRIRVTSPRFKDMLQHSLEEVENLLASWSGVQEVHIRCNSDRTGENHHILVSAFGRDWQRWFLEELLLQPWFEKAVEKRDLDSFLNAQ